MKTDNEKRETFDTLLNAVREAKIGKPFTEEALDFWWDTCGHLGERSFANAIHALARDSTRMPDMSEVLRIATTDDAPPWDSNRLVKCVRCKDAGYQLEDVEGYLCTVPCECETGREWNERGVEWTRSMAGRLPENTDPFYFSKARAKRRRA